MSDINKDGGVPVSDVLLMMANDCAKKWEHIWLGGKSEELKKMIYSSIEETMKDAVMSLTENRVRNRLEPRISEAVDAAITKWMYRKDIEICEPTEQTVRAINDVLKWLPDSAATAAAKRKLIFIYRMHTAGIDDDAIAHRLGVRTREAKRLISVAVKRAEAARAEYDSFFNSKAAVAKKKKQA